MILVAGSLTTVAVIGFVLYYYTGVEVMHTLAYVTAPVAVLAWVVAGVVSWRFRDRYLRG